MDLINYYPVNTYFMGDTVITANNFKGNILDVTCVSMLAEELDIYGNSLNVFSSKLTTFEYFSLNTYKYMLTGGVVEQPIVIRCFESVRRPIVKALKEKYKNAGVLKSVKPKLEDYQPVLVEGKVTKIYQLGNKHLRLSLNDFSYEVYRLNGSTIVTSILRMISEDIQSLGYAFCGFITFNGERKFVYTHNNYSVLIGKTELNKLFKTNEVYLILVVGDIV